MPWKLNFLGTDPRLENTAVGDCWLHTPEDKALWLEHTAGNYYKEKNSHRLPCYVCLPDSTFFCVDSRASHDPERKGWTVSGEPPNITVSPSIKIDSKRPKGNGGSGEWEDYTCYHGFIENGILKEDCDGRLFPDDTPYLNRTKNRIP